eukprot:g21060.t1
MKTPLASQAKCIVQDKIILGASSPLEKLAHSYALAQSARELSKQMGELLMLRCDVNLHTDILDTPDIFWDEERFEKIYVACRTYLDIARETENDEVISALKELPRPALLAFRQELALQPFSQALRCLESSLKIDELRSSWNAETVATSLAAALGDGLWCWSFETTSDEVDSAHKALKTMLEDGRKQLLEALRSGESFCATVKRCTSKKDGQALMKLGKTRVMWLLGSGPDEGNDLTDAKAEVLDAVRWLQEAEAILICGELEEEETGLFRLPPFSTSAGSLEYGVPAQGSWSPLRALWREHVQLDSAKLFESDPALAWAFWGFWSKRYLEGMPSAFYQCLGGWARTRPRGCFCVTGEISGHWARSIGEERLWETRGSVSHLLLLKLPQPPDTSKRAAVTPGSFYRKDNRTQRYNRCTWTIEEKLCKAEISYFAQSQLREGAPSAASHPRWQLQQPVHYNLLQKAGKGLVLDLDDRSRQSCSMANCAILHQPVHQALYPQKQNTIPMLLDQDK